MFLKHFLIVALCIFIVSCTLIKNDHLDASIYYDSMWQKKRFHVDIQTFKSEANISTTIISSTWPKDIVEILQLNRRKFTPIHHIPNKMNINLVLDTKFPNMLLIATYNYIYLKHNEVWNKYTLTQKDKNIIHCAVINICRNKECTLSKSQQNEIKEIISEYKLDCSSYKEELFSRLLWLEQEPVELI